jgi:hypothetical protein
MQYTTRSSFPSSRQVQSVTDEQTKEGEDDKEKQSDEDNKDEDDS